MSEALVVTFVQLDRGLLGDVTFNVCTHDCEIIDLSKVVVS